MSALPTNLALCRDQPKVVPRIDAPAIARLGQIVVEQLGEGDRAVKVILQDLPRHGCIETKVLCSRWESPKQTGGDERSGAIHVPLVDHFPARRHAPFR
jgi:hypothetical protein